MGAVDDAVAAIQAGQLVVLPTDTVYGLCVTPYREEPVFRAYRLKQRPESQPSALLCSDLRMLFECLPELHGRPGLIARELLPGPYTLVFANPAHRYPWLTGERTDAIGVRVPELEGDAAEVLRRVGAVMATSANLHGGPDPRRLEDVPEEIRAECAVVLDGGALAGTPSTVIDFTGIRPRVIREGAGSALLALQLVDPQV